MAINSFLTIKNVKETQMKNTKENVLNLQTLESKLGVKMTKAKRNTTKLSLKAQITHKVNEKIHELLCNEFSEYYKEIETDAITNCKGETQIQKIRGYRLMIPKSVAIGNEEHNGPLYRGEKDYDGRKYKILICEHFRQDEKKEKLIIPEDLFNGA